MSKIKKTKQELLERFNRANQDYKATILAREGYKTKEDYIKYLKGGRVKTAYKIKEKVTIHNVFILDASGSMSGGKYNNGVEGIKSIVKSIQEDKLTNNTLTIIEFCGARGVMTNCYLSDPKSVEFTGRGAQGGTPLYKTLGETINKLLKDKSKTDKVLLNVTTDGEDTEGFGEYSNLPQTLKRIQSDDNFTVTFVGTQLDVDRTIRNLNIDRSNTLVHDNTAIGMKMSFNTTNLARTSYSTRASLGEDVLTGFYKQQETL